MLEHAVDLVAEEPGVALPRHVHDLAKQRLVDQRAGRVVGVVQDDEAGAIVAGGTDRVRIRQVPVRLAQPHLAHLGAERRRHGEELLVGRLHGDDGRPRLDERVQGEEVGADRAVGGQHVVRRDALAVQRRDGGAQPRRADDVAVAEPGLPEAAHHAVGVAAHLEQLVEGERVDAGLGDVPGGRRLVGVHPLLDEERLDVHGGLRDLGMDGPWLIVPPREPAGKRRDRRRRATGTAAGRMTAP